MIRIVVSVILVALVFVTLPQVESFGAQDQPKCRVKGDPLLIGGASFLIPGLGQFLNGEDSKGLVHLVVGLGLPTAVYVISLASPLGELVYVLAPLLYLGWGVYSAMDAYNLSSNHCKP